MSEEPVERKLSRLGGSPSQGGEEVGFRVAAFGLSGSESSAFENTPGLNGAWFNPATLGQGVPARLEVEFHSPERVPRSYRQILVVDEQGDAFFIHGQNVVGPGWVSPVYDSPDSRPRM